MKGLKTGSLLILPVHKHRGSNIQHVGADGDGNIDKTEKKKIDITVITTLKLRSSPLGTIHGSMGVLGLWRGSAGLSLLITHLFCCSRPRPDP